MNDFTQIDKPDSVPKDLWFLLQYAVMGDFDKISNIVSRINEEGKILVAVYPGVSELMKGIDVSEMEYIGDIMDGGLYLK
ncbi:MAG: hypothetical protein PHH37_04205 [Paludibacter sp.]|nr:hypothetical protein [Paludibacter sp.]